MKIFMAISLLSSSYLLANMNSKPSPKDRPYDYDLFSKDRECEYIELEGLCLKMLNNVQIGAVSSTPNNFSSGASDPSAKLDTVNINFLWQPGFRVTVGYFNAPKYWEVMGQYTWFQDKGNKTVTSPNASEDYLSLGGYYPLEPAATSGHLTKITGYSNLYYNDASVLATRNWYPNAHLRMRIYGGLTSLWTHQTTNVYNTFSIATNTLNYAYRTKYWGVGFKMGTGADWYWGKDFYLTGKVFWSIVTGRWNTSTTVSSGGAMLYQPTDHYYLATQNFQFIFGPSYQKSYEKQRLEIFVGYEFNTWLDALTTYNYNAPTEASSWTNPQSFYQDLVLTGVNIRLTLDF